MPLAATGTCRSVGALGLGLGGDRGNREVAGRPNPQGSGCARHFREMAERATLFRHSETSDSDPRVCSHVPGKSHTKFLRCCREMCAVRSCCGQRHLRPIGGPSTPVQDPLQHRALSHCGRPTVRYATRRGSRSRWWRPRRSPAMARPPPPLPQPPLLSYPTLRQDSPHLRRDLPPATACDLKPQCNTDGGQVYTWTTVPGGSVR